MIIDNFCLLNVLKASGNRRKDGEGISKKKKKKIINTTTNCKKIRQSLKKLKQVLIKFEKFHTIKNYQLLCFCKFNACCT